MTALIPLTSTNALGSADSGNRNSRPFYWPGGEGDLCVKGSLGSGTVTLYQGPLSLDATARAAKASYRAHGSTVAADDGADRFFGGEGWYFIELTGSTGSDSFDCWLARVSNDAKQQPYFDPENESAVA